MITFKSTEDLSKLPPTDPAFPTIKDLVDRLITEYTPPGGTYNHEDYGLVFVIPDAPWVDGELRAMIEDNLDPLPETL